MADQNPTRTADLSRKTKETQIRVALDLDGTGNAQIKTGVGFFDHMLDLLSRHSLIDLTVEAQGDLHIDAHHTVEDVGIVLGQAIEKALGDKKGIYRYGSATVPMDESLGGRSRSTSPVRPAFVYNVGSIAGRRDDQGNFPSRNWSTNSSNRSRRTRR